MRVAAVDQGTSDPTPSRRHRGRRAGRSLQARGDHASREGVDARRRLLPVPITRVRNVLTGYRREAEQRGAERILLVATSAVRDAENGEAFLGEIEWVTASSRGFSPGTRRPRCLPRRGGRRIGSTLVIDPGGGSTEFVVGEPRSIRQSVDVGSTRLTERFPHRPADRGGTRGGRRLRPRRPPRAAGGRSDRGRRGHDHHPGGARPGARRTGRPRNPRPPAHL